MTGHEFYHHRRQLDAEQMKRDRGATEVQVLSQLLDQYVTPHITVQNPDVLIVGSGSRYAEIIAVYNQLKPSHITSADVYVPKPTMFYLLKDALRDGIAHGVQLLSSVSIVPSDFQDLNQSFDIVFAFSLSPYLQYGSGAKNLLGKSRGLTVATAYKHSGLTFDRIPEYDHIDTLFEDGGASFITRKERLDIPTTDGHIWVMQKASGQNTHGS